jgi:hypothetical protein
MQTVKTPMDLGTIRQYLEAGTHYKDPTEVCVRGGRRGLVCGSMQRVLRSNNRDLTCWA